MKIIVELDGVIFDALAAQYRAHQAGTKAVGWSCLDENRFRRAIRKQGLLTDLLPGASAMKAKQYASFIQQALETDQALSALAPVSGIVEHIKRILRHATLIGVSVGANIAARRESLKRCQLSDHFQVVEQLSVEPKRRPVELKMLAGDERRCVVLAASDMLMRSAGSAELIAVGLSTGICSSKRLFQGGADLVYTSLEEFAESLEGGAPDLVRAGLMPLSLG